MLVGLGVLVDLGTLAGGTGLGRGRGTELGRMELEDGMMGLGMEVGRMRLEESMIGLGVEGRVERRKGYSDG